MIKLFTMAKDENDIVEDWILYHGTIFGYHNLYIVDNESTDGTYDIIKNYEEKGVHIYSHPNYLEKGNIMKQFIDNNPCTIAFPLDIDEFIVYYDKESNTISIDNIITYLDTLIEAGNLTNNNNGLYKCDYIHSKLTTPSRKGYNRAVLECTRGRYDYNRTKIMTKAFFDTRKWNGIIDHGNHFNTYSEYTMSNLCLVHYHKRNLEQHKKKVINNLQGLGYNPYDLNALKELNKGCPGSHHVKEMIRILENKYSLNCNEPIYSTDIRLTPISNFIKKEMQDRKNETVQKNQLSRFEFIKNRK